MQHRAVASDCRFRVFFGGGGLGGLRLQVASRIRMLLLKEAQKKVQKQVQFLESMKKQRQLMGTGTFRQFNNNEKQEEAKRWKLPRRMTCAEPHGRNALNNKSTER